jgi:hypothetical protein
MRSDRGGQEEIALGEGLTVADFERGVLEGLARLGVRPSIRETPFGVPMTTPFPEDTEHSTYQAEYVERFWRVLLWVDDALGEFAGRFAGKQSPVHLFWHSFDLALNRFSGRPAPPMPGVDPVTREAYSHEVISFGFWAGSEQVREPAFYSYTAPEPAELRGEPLSPPAARWVDTGSGSLAVLRYDDVRADSVPREVLLGFLESAYEAGARRADWPRELLTPGEGRP